MMMTQPFPAHQGMAQHGFPQGHPTGHPMNAQHPNGHPVPGMVQQMHPGVSASGGPQASQAGPMMAGMPPGAGTTSSGVPNAHALSHLNPAPQGQMFSPQYPYQPHQQEMMRQRMMIQRQQQQQQQQHGLPVSMPNGTQGLSPAQMAAMQGRPVNMAHLQQQMPHGQPQNFQHPQQFLAMQQAQAQHAHQAQAQQAHQAQQAQAQQAQQTQAQQAQAQSQVGTAGQQTPQRTSAQPPNMHEQSATPQSQHGVPPPGSGTPQPTQASQPPSAQPTSSQVAPQTQPTPTPPSQQLPHSQQPGQLGQPGPQHQPPQNAQGQQQGPPNQQMTPQEIQLKAQQHQMMMQQRMKLQNQSILTLNDFSEKLCDFKSQNEAQDLAYWQSFVDRFYSPVGVLRQGVWSNAAGSKQFEIATPALARYYLRQFTSGIASIQMVVEGARERESHNGGHYVEAPKCSFIYWYQNGSQLFTNGSLRAHFDVNNKLEMLDIRVTNHTEFISRSLLLAIEAESLKQSPKMPKNAKRLQQKPVSSVLPESIINPYGMPTEVMEFLEVAETMSQMQMLVQFSQSNPQLSPPDALRNLVSSFQSQVPNPGLMNPGMHPMHPGMHPGMSPAMSPAMNPAMNPSMNPGMHPMQAVRGPGMGVPSQFASPAMAHLGLPGQQGSPHLTGSAHPSPAQSQMAGPQGMQPPMQPSPAGVNNNSPNVGGNKRRRASTVKMESEDGTGFDANGAPQGSVKVKPSPRVPKRQKGAAA